MFLSHIHIFRAFAILGIVGAHSLHAFEWNDHAYMFRFFDTLFNQSSVMFFFIAGFMFRYLSDRFEKYDYWGKKFRNVIVPYLLLSIPSIYYYTQIAVQDNTWAGFYDYPLYKQVFYFLITGKHMAPFWFVPTIALFYLVAPLMLRADRDGRIYWLLPVFMCISFVLGRGGQYGPINKAIYLFSVYLFGMFICVYHDEVLRIVQRFQYFLLAMVLILIGGNMSVYGYDQYFQYVLKIILCPLLLFYLFKAKHIVGDRLNYLGHVSFGIFFIHSYVLPAIKLTYLKFSGNEAFPEGNLVAYMVLTAAVTIVCMAIIYLIQKVFGKRSRMVVGA
ncbi:MAG: surface polysaccharide O-acyltransferase-like enzyme [Cellvibrionaceae bacterium]|jgi:surface polysaccharide O-acyltransferase-like enzyme